MDEVDALDRGLRVVGDGELGAVLLLELAGDAAVFVRRPQLLRAAQAHVHAHQAADDHERVAHVAAGVADIGVFDLRDRLVAVLAHGHHVGQHLGRVILVGEPVVDRHARVLGQLLDDLLAGAAILDRVEHAAEHARGVLGRFLVAHLRARRVEIGHLGALVVAGDLEGAARAGRGLLEDQADLLALEVLLLGARIFRALQVAGEIEQVLELLLGVVLHRQQRAVAQVECHVVLPPFLSRAQSSGSRRIGQVMQWPPPRPRPSSEP